MSTPDHWHAFECYDCFRARGDCVVFDVRSALDLTTAKCPICGATCALKSFGRWPASVSGFGGRAEVDLHLDELRDRASAEDNYFAHGSAMHFAVRSTAWGLA